MISRLELQEGTTATHILESQGQQSSKCGMAPQLLTFWRAKERHDQQARIAEKHHRHSLPGEPRTDMINRIELQQGTTATHFLESQGQHDQQARIAARHHSHSQTGQPRTGMISRLELQQGTIATHKLESQGQV